MHHALDILADIIKALWVCFVGVPFFFFMLDVFREIRYALWSRSVVRHYAKANAHLQPKPAKVPVDGSRYNVPIILLSAVLVAEVVLLFVL